MHLGKLVPRAAAAAAAVEQSESLRHPIGTSMKFVDAPEEKRDCDALSSGRVATQARTAARRIAANAGIPVFTRTPRPQPASHRAEQLQLRAVSELPNGRGTRPVTRRIERAPALFEEAVIPASSLSPRWTTAGKTRARS